MDIALFSANANQLRYILDHGSMSQAYFYIASSLIILSLILQVSYTLLNRFLLLLAEKRINKFQTNLLHFTPNIYTTNT